MVNQTFGRRREESASQPGLDNARSLTTPHHRDSLRTGNYPAFAETMALTSNDNHDDVSSSTTEAATRFSSIEERLSGLYRMLQRQQEENAELKEKMRLLEADRDVAPDRISTLADSDAALTKDLVRVADKNGQQPRTISHPGPGQNSLDGSGSALDNQLGAGTSGAGSAQRALPRRAHQRDSAYSPANEQPGEGQERVLDRDEEQGSNGFHDEDDFVPFQSSLDLVDPSNANESFGDGIPLYPEKTSTRTKAGKTKRPFST